ncbi:MAG: hypothetical protein L0241_03685 [Planctomycetia bacterium]|nr:hypothetical protein [Planctomycetia bacterium]
MRQVIRFAGCLAGVLFASTAFAQPPSQPKATDYYPLTKGTKWVYKVGEVEVTQTVVGTERFNNEDCIKLEMRAGDEIKSTELLAVRSDGIFRVKTKDDVIKPPVKVLPAVIKVGDTWPVNLKVGGAMVKGNLTVKSDKEKVKVPAGEFDAILIESQNLVVADSPVTLRSWFVRGRGVVKNELSLAGGMTIVQELVKFEPGIEPKPPTVPPSPEPPTTQPWASPSQCYILPAYTVHPVPTRGRCGCCARFGWRLGRR